MPLENFYRGDTVEIEIEFTQEDGTPLDITGYSVFISLKKYYNDDDSKAVLTKKITNHTDPINGKTTIKLLPDETNVEPNIYFYDIQLVKDDENVFTVDSGLITVLPDITRRID